MSKYFFVLKNSIQQRMVYRFNTFSFIVSGFMNFGVLFYFWGSVYRQGNQIGTYTFQAIASYYLLANFINLIVRPDDKAWRIADEIRTGNLNSVLLRPISYFWFHFFQSVGSLIFVTAVYVPVMATVIFLLGDSISVTSDPVILLLSAFSVMLAFVINFIIFFTIGISSFYFGMVKGLNYSTYVISTFLAGSIIPLDIFPEKFKSINDLLPFKYSLYIPIEMLSGRIRPELWMFVFPIIWIVILGGVSFMVYKYGIRKYEGYGA